ncbi:hypothetical protein VNO78_01435 [Psophocarpus tetragonolobus]|uniref:Auxin response factor n=1 Tax=Psophocarpus tetragonolobus TaxID=3891 RepID=A0AAN9T1M0_PSOTE
MPRQPPPSPPSRPGILDPKIWRACAGGTVEIPTLNSRVYYFPQGHFDQASSPPRNLSPELLAKPFILCTVASVQFLADPLTDEVFAKLILHPIANAAGPLPSVPSPPPPPQNDDNKVVTFSKILTASDANNGGGFSVPRYCADSVFPPLNFQADPPVQNLFVTDVHGFVWEFRHIYRGTPRRHLLTTGWSTFVNNKKLVAGDSVVFMKNSNGGLFVGIRRATRFAPVRNRVEEKEEEEEEDEEAREVFSRDGRGKLSAKVVAEAAELAARNKPFDVVYYPKTGWSEFVVKTEAVDEAMSVAWSPRIKVKMAMDSEDSSRLSWHQGEVSAVSLHGNGLWRGSPWRMLQITWDETNDPYLQNVKWVNPWQVELVSTTPALHSAFTPTPTPTATKKCRTALGSGVFTNGERDPYSVTRFSTMGQLNQTLLSYRSFPAGMQGARHDVFSASNFTNYPSDMSHLFMGSSFGNNTFPKMKVLSTELNVGSPPQSDEFSLDSRGSLHSSGTDLAGNHNCKKRKLVSVSFQLFGAVIQTEQHVENGLQGTGCTCTGSECQRASTDDDSYL